MKVVGQVDVNVEYEGQQVQLPLLIVWEHKLALFGRDWLTAVKLDWTTYINYVVTQLLQE